MRNAIALTAALMLTAKTPAAQPPDPGLAAPVVSALRAEPGARPRLVVVISIDQLRADYLTRLADLFGEGGFKRLTGGGAWFVNAHFEHFPLTTGAGHAVLLTGAAPYKTGIIGNDWWDPVARRLVYCVDQPRARVVGALPAGSNRPMGPKNLRSTTVGDELKFATAGRSKGVSVGLKDRA
ncbi:MAG TPA: alkaline phosphatase family protein, partial [Phycisphaerales bacterium]|nr:alkaline phosphatase family protein [Phycisphaerales bacterium]